MLNAHNLSTNEQLVQLSLLSTFDRNLGQQIISTPVDLTDPALEQVYGKIVGVATHEGLTVDRRSLHDFSGRKCNLARE